MKAEFRFRTVIKLPIILLICSILLIVFLVLQEPSIGGLDDFNKIFSWATLTPLHILTPTPPQSLAETEAMDQAINSRLYYYSALNSYGYFEHNGETFHRPNEIDLASPENDMGPAYSGVFAFSNNSNMIAYITFHYPNELWIADLDKTRPRLLVTDINKELLGNDFAISRLTWAEDDKHIFIEPGCLTTQNSIVNLETNGIEPWFFDCDRVAISTKTNRLATWCRPTTSGDMRYAVLEWGSEIWYDESNPQDVLVQSGEATIYGDKPGKINNWMWSKNGEHLAYFNQSGDLLVANARGDTKELILPRKAYWLLETQPVGLPPQHPISWSEDGNTLLIYAVGDNVHSCPKWRNIYVEEEISNDVACWQVVDLQTKEIVWSVSDSAENLIFPSKIEYLPNFTYSEAAISPNGELVAISLSNGGSNYLRVVNLATNHIEGSWNIRVNSMIWVRQSEDLLRP